MIEGLNLAGRVALVTGAGGGAARAIALALGQAGAAVGVNDVNPDRADTVAEMIADAGGRAFPWAADVGNRFQISAMIERLRDEFGGLHILVSGWAVNKQENTLRLDEYDWRRVIEVNLTGAFMVSQLAARVMVDEIGGVIVQLVSAPPADTIRQAPYVASMAGLSALTAALDAELAPLGVRTAAVAIREEADGDSWTTTVDAALAAIRARWVA
jgi:NAD(P)-dependent dehydrogenase (short-subunit alcohol dehydrogenase family)